MSDAAHAPLTQARRVEGAAGVLASLCGLIAVGVVILVAMAINVQFDRLVARSRAK